MLHAAVQTNSYQSNLSDAVSHALSSAKPELISDQKQKGSVHAASEVKQAPAKDQMTFSIELDSVNKAIDQKVAEFFSKYPCGGTDHDVARFLESVRASGI